MEIKSVESFPDYYEKIRGRTLRVIKTIPPDKMNWSYHEGKFTLADLVRHIASTERYMFAETIRANKSRYPGHGPELADGYDNVLAFFDRAHRESVAIFRQLAARSLRTLRPRSRPLPNLAELWYPHSSSCLGPSDC